MSSLLKIWELLYMSKHRIVLIFHDRVHDKPYLNLTKSYCLSTTYPKPPLKKSFLVFIIKMQWPESGYLQCFVSNWNNTQHLHKTKEGSDYFRISKLIYWPSKD